jgi:uncharacterized protein with NAD-binding domain and iron-sulfur cluster
MTELGPQKTRIAILGGGIGALTAAFELTEQDRAGTKYDISIYTVGWRLGGKASVGRDKLQQWRAFEHGLHVWSGFYDNAFDLVQRLYDRIKCRLECSDEECSKFGELNYYDWRSKFEGLNHLTVMEFDCGTWKPWVLDLLPNGLDPGISFDHDPAPLVFLTQLFSWLEQSFIQSDLPGYLNPQTSAEVRRGIAEIVGDYRLASGATPLSTARELTARLPSDPQAIGEGDKTKILSLLQLFRSQVEKAVAAAPDGDDQARRLDILYDLAVAIATGIFTDRVLRGGFDAIDDCEWSKWISDNGCKPTSVNSAIVRGCYDYVFGYVRGVRSVAAGVGTLSLLRFLLTYKGSVFFTLREPMGDFLFAPLYEYLCSRGVRFNFFHRVDSLGLSGDGRHIQNIVLGRQVKLKNHETGYEPLVCLPRKNNKSWPLHPDYDQIEDGDRLRDYDLESAWTDWPDALGPRILRRRSVDGNKRDDDRDTFDIAILAIGLGGLSKICSELTNRFPATWGNCCEQVKTVATLGVELWARPQVDKLGWLDSRTVLSGFALEDDTWCKAPLHSWADNSPLLALEVPTTCPPPRSLAYFVGIFPDADAIPCPPDPDFPESETRRAKAAVADWMDNRLTVLWPNARDPETNGFLWNLLDSPADVIGRERLDWQYVRPNINPSERYVLSVPSSLRHRLWPDGSGISNLFLAGDWVRTGLDAGCIEAAVMAGRAAARAITGANMNIPGFGNSGRISVPITLLPLVNLIKQFKTHTAGGVGSMDAYCVTMTVASADVQKMLPSGLHLTPPGGSTDSHPLVLLFSRQHNVRPGFMPFGGINYHEFIALIPYVERDDVGAPTGGPFSYMTHLLLDELPPVLIGVNLYGYNKRLARISSSGGSFDIRSDLGEIRARFRERGLPGSAALFPNLDSVRQLLEHPLVSLTASGVWVYSHLDFCFDAANFQGVVGNIAIGAPFAPSVAPDHTFPSIGDEQFGAFRFQTRWSLSVPLTSGDISDNVMPPDLRNFAASLAGTRLGAWRGR